MELAQCEIFWPIRGTPSIVMLAVQRCAIVARVVVRLHPPPHTMFLVGTQRKI